jgi:hypothetical protein
VNYDLIYSGLHSISWKRFQGSICELARVDLSLLNNDIEKMTFWINVYNIIIIHTAILLQKLPDDEITRELLYKKIKYNVGNQDYSLLDIREGILLGNQSKSLIFGRQFKRNDERRRYIIAKPSILVLFALSELSKQSTSVEIINCKHIHGQLERIATEYLDNILQMDQHCNLLIPKSFLKRGYLFRCYAIDHSIPIKNDSEAVFAFVKQFASYFKQEQIKNDAIHFTEDYKSLETIIANALPKDIRIMLENKLNPSSSKLENNSHEQQSKINQRNFPISKHRRNTKLSRDAESRKDHDSLFHHKSQCLVM